MSGTPGIVVRVNTVGLVTGSLLIVYQKGEAHLEDGVLCSSFPSR